MTEDKGEKEKAEGTPEPTVPADPYHGYYYPPPGTAKKDPISIKLILGIIIIIIVFVFIYILIVSLVLMSEPEKDEQTYEFDAIIKDGGYYRYTLDDDYYYNDDTEVEIEISSTNGSRFDVYIMDGGQFASAYWTEDDGALSFASIRSWENVQEVEDKFDLPQISGDDTYLVIDNKITNLTRNDADPQGDITVSVKVTIISDYEPFFWSQ